MRINNIGGSNYKQGRETDQPIGAVHVFIGPTGCGKTTMLDLVRLAIEANPLDSTYSAINLIHRDFATNGGLIRAVIKTDNGLSLARFIGLDKKGGIKQQVKFMGETFGKVEAAKAIAEVLNPCAEALDFGLFRAKSDIERQAYLLGLVESPEGWDRSKVWATCSEAIAENCRLCKNCSHYTMYSEDQEPPDDPHEELSYPDNRFGACGNDVRETEGSAFGCFDWSGPAGLINGKDILTELFEAWPNIPMKATDGVLGLKEKIKTMMSEANKAARAKATLEEELQSFVDEKAGTVDVGKADRALSGDLTAVTRKLHDKQARKDDLVKLIAAEGVKAKEHTRWSNAKALNDGDVKKAKDDLEGVRAGADDFDAEIDAANAKLHTAETIGQLQDELSALEAKLPDLQSAKEKEKAVYIELRAQEDMYRELLGFLNDPERFCPKAGDLLIRCPAEWDEGDLETARFNAEIGRNKRKAKADIAKALRDECRNEIEKLTTTLQRYDIDSETLAATLENIRTRMESHKAGVEMKDQAVTAAVKRYDDHLEAEPHAKGVADVEKAEQELTGIKTTITTLEADITTKTEGKGRKLAMLRAERDRLELGQRIEIYKKLRVTIGKLIEEILGIALGGLKMVIDLCLPKDWAVALNADDDGFFVGAYIPDVGAVISLNSMSAGQQAIFAVAVRIALMNAADAKLKVLLCEMDTLDAAYTEQVLDIAVQAVEQGYLDNFIGATNRHIPHINGVGVNVLNAISAKGVA